MKRIAIITCVAAAAMNAAMGMAMKKPTEASEVATHWEIVDNSAIRLDATNPDNLPYSDDIEMAGKRVAAIVSYEIDEEGVLTLSREVLFPQLHEFKSEGDSWFHDYRAYLRDDYGDDILPTIYVNNERFVPGPVRAVVIAGELRFEHAPSVNGLALSRRLFPSMDERLFREEWTLTNTTNVMLEIASESSYRQIVDYGGKGRFTRWVEATAPRKHQLLPDQYISVSAEIKAGLNDEKHISGERAAGGREKFLKAMAGSLQLETPEPSLDTLFAFSKIRASESIFESELGLIHSPGGGRYYVGIWANDEAEYVSPFFPYLGYDVGLESAMNCYRAFAGEMNPEYTKIRYSFEIEGLVKPFLKDRGDAAMIAYGAAQYALANGDQKTAAELWPLIEWCLEYCHRQLNEEGVVRSESDEMEGRIETGTANLSTSSLYYGALNYAAALSEALGQPDAELYATRAAALRRAIEDYFGAKVEGLETYKYYKEHDRLRHWICLPLVVGIDDRADATTEALFDRLWTDNGVHVEKNNKDPKISEIFWDRGTLYAFRGAFIAGATERALERLVPFSETRLLGDRVPYVVEASPEGDMAHLSAESALYCRIFIEGVFGINPTGFNSFTLTPRLPAEWDKMALRKVKAFGGDFDIDVSRTDEGMQVRVTNRGVVVVDQVVNDGETIDVSFE